MFPLPCGRRNQRIDFSICKCVLCVCVRVCEFQIPLAQGWSIVLAAQRLWVQFQGTRILTKKMYNLNASRFG